ncbi:RES domain protein [Pseudodesulfovibrio hydrargyri]|uniref:RES domain protein n=1 Tax=Pseudodesulfovibrio hydrargyri TaxID=2125990 RepID=A0A1J5MRY4_9BACT|nr:RES family NAD+ phosphorylase [Pseudodesulfovibrio hydrargyri]OIQ49358.1 RES domain protein [Pseudodesulfovibrio hydrargyri]
MRAFRIVQTRRVATCLDGEGARRAGGRWNSKGKPVTYTGTNIALCHLEILVHMPGTDLTLLPFSIMEVDVPDELVIPLDLSLLPEDWKSPENAECKRLGDAWLDAADSVGLLVPSAVVPMENNLLLNPGHPGFKAVNPLPPLPIHFDPRLFAGRK